MNDVRALFHGTPLVLESAPATARAMARTFGMTYAEVNVRLFMHKTIHVSGVGDLTVYLWGDRQLTIELTDHESKEIVEIFDGIMPDEIRNAADLERMARTLFTQWMFDHE